jgi:hypothetical protein
VRGYHSPYQEIFATQDLDQVLYFAAEEAVRSLAEHIVARSPCRGPVTNLVTGQAEMLDQLNSAWGSRFRSGGMDGTQTAQPCGHDPLERLAWIAGAWREQDPYTNLAFFRGEGISAEQIAQLHGANPDQTATGTRLSDLRSMDGAGRDYWEIAWETFCFGQAGDWAFLGAAPPTQLDHPELTGEFELYFHALENALGLQLPQQDIQEGTVQAAQWARTNSGRG